MFHIPDTHKVAFISQLPVSVHLLVITTVCYVVDLNFCLFALEISGFCSANGVWVNKCLKRNRKVKMSKSQYQKCWGWVCCPKWICIKTKYF